MKLKIFKQRESGAMPKKQMSTGSSAKPSKSNALDVPNYPSNSRAHGAKLQVTEVTRTRSVHAEEVVTEKRISIESW